MSKKNEKTPEPMDTTIREKTIGTPVVNNFRTCGALKQLISEVEALFPETPYETSGFDGRNTALAASFDFTGLDDQGRADACTLLVLMVDRRIQSVDVEDGVALVQIYSNPRTQDSRDSFGLAAALEVLAEEGSL